VSIVLPTIHIRDIHQETKHNIPWTMMIHFNNTSIANTTMMSSIWLVRITSSTNSFRSLWQWNQWFFQFYPRSHGFMKCDATARMAIVVNANVCNFPQMVNCAFV
jgi:hypothetical protein